MVVDVEREYSGLLFVSRLGGFGDGDIATYAIHFNFTVTIAGKIDAVLTSEG